MQRPLPQRGPSPLPSRLFSFSLGALPVLAEPRWDVVGRTFLPASGGNEGAAAPFRSRPPGLDTSPEPLPGATAGWLQETTWRPRLGALTGWPSVLCPQHLVSWKASGTLACKWLFCSVVETLQIQRYRRQTTVVEEQFGEVLLIKIIVKRLFKYDEDGVRYFMGTTIKFSADQFGNMQ